jgi:antitoxin component of MazEF toxin-antitoxin module
MQDGLIKETTAEVVKVGDELVVRLPKGEAERLELKAGDALELRRVNSAADSTGKPTVDELFDRVRRMRGIRPAGYQFNREEANSRGTDDAK